jgi:hypothetical protein
MMIKANAGLAQHAEKRVFGAVIRMVMAADITDPTGGLTQPEREGCFILKQGRSPGDKRRRHGLVAPEAQ